MSEPPARIPCHNGDEYDVFTAARKVYCWTKKAGACRRVKRGYQRRLRHITRKILRSAAA